MLESFETELRGVLRRYDGNEIKGIIMHGTPMERRICVDLFPEHLDILGRDMDWGVRYGVACSPFTTAETRLMLARDEIREVRIGCAEWSAGTPVEDILANDKIWLVRREMAKHATGAVLERLAGDESALVRSGAVVNPNLDFEVLVGLCGDDDATVSRWARAAAEWRLEQRRSEEVRESPTTPPQDPQNGTQRRSGASGGTGKPRAGNTRQEGGAKEEGSGSGRPRRTTTRRTTGTGASKTTGGKGKGAPPRASGKD